MILVLIKISSQLDMGLFCEYISNHSTDHSLQVSNPNVRESYTLYWLFTASLTIWHATVLNKTQHRPSLWGTVCVLMEDCQCFWGNACCYEENKVNFQVKVVKLEISRLTTLLLIDIVQNMTDMTIMGYL